MLGEINGGGRPLCLPQSPLRAGPGTAAVARQHREGAVTETSRDAILARLNRDFAQMTVVEVRAAMLSRVPALVVRWPLRGYDAVQLAAALTLQATGVSTTFWASDANLVAAALGEGLRATEIG